MALAVEIQDLGFHYRNQPPLIQGMTLSIPEGCRFGIFGPNGAGKTTLMNLMAGLLPYKKGQIRILDFDVSTEKMPIKKIMGMVPQDFSFYEELSPAENMAFFGAWYGMPKELVRRKTENLLEKMGLGDVRNKPVKLFSGGMKRRVNLAIGVMNDPKVLFLDEPTVGVDVQSRSAIIEFLKKINQAGATLIYTSHQLKEAEELCEEVALIDQGQIIAHNTLEQLLEQHQKTGLEGLFLGLTGRDYRD